MSGNRICLIVAFVLLLIAGLGRRPFDDTEGQQAFALIGLAFWALSGAV